MTIRALMLFVLLWVWPSYSRTYVYEGFDSLPGQTLPGNSGYGLVPEWSFDPEDTYSPTQYILSSGSLETIGSTDFTKLERPGMRKGQIATLHREIAEPIGTVGTVRYLGFLIRTPTYHGLPTLWPANIHFGMSLTGASTSIFFGAASTGSGVKFGMRRVPDLTGVSGGPVLTWNTTYFCVMRMEFTPSSTICSMYIDSANAAVADATFQIAPGLLRSLEITSNYSFAIDEIRVAETFDDLLQTAPRVRPEISVFPQTIAEGNGEIIDHSVEVRLSSPSDFSVYADYSFEAGSADFSDFLPGSGRIHFPPGQDRAAITFRVLGDCEGEPDEKAQVRLERIVGAGGLSPSSPLGTIHILNDDLPHHPPRGLWSTQLNASGSGAFNQAVVDSSGNCNAVAFISGSAIFAGATHGSGSSLVQFRPDGTISWFKDLVGTNSNVIRGLALDDSGLYITGYSYGNLRIDSTELQITNIQTFIARLSTDGDLLWLKKLASPHRSEGNSIAVTDSQVLVSGYYFTNIFYPGITSVPASHGLEDLFVLSLDKDGSFQWVINGGGKWNDMASMIVTCPDNTSITACTLSGDTTFAGQRFNAQTRSVALAKLSSGGKLEWLRSFPGAYQRGLAVAPSGDVFFGGFHRETIKIDNIDLPAVSPITRSFVASTTPEGVVRWVQPIHSTGDAYLMSIQSDAAGNVLIAGEFNGVLTVGSACHAGVAQRDAFFAKLNPEGSVIWLHVVGGSADDSGYHLTSRNNSLYMMGKFQDRFTLAGTFLRAQRSNDGFLLKAQDPLKLNIKHTSSGASFDYQGQPGIPFLLTTSTDLKTWDPPIRLPSSPDGYLQHEYEGSQRTRFFKVTQP